MIPLVSTAPAALRSSGDLSRRDRGHRHPSIGASANNVAIQLGIHSAMFRLITTVAALYSFVRVCNHSGILHCRTGLLIRTAGSLETTLVPVP